VVSFTTRPLYFRDIASGTHWIGGISWAANRPLGNTTLLCRHLSVIVSFNVARFSVEEINLAVNVELKTV